jgi:hypothetical protein
MKLENIEVGQDLFTINNKTIHRYKYLGNGKFQEQDYDHINPLVWNEKEINFYV